MKSQENQRNRRSPQSNNVTPTQHNAPYEKREKLRAELDDWTETVPDWLTPTETVPDWLTLTETVPDFLFASNLGLVSLQELRLAQIRYRAEQNPWLPMKQALGDGTPDPLITPIGKRRKLPCGRYATPGSVTLGTVHISTLYHGSRSFFEEPFLPDRTHNSFAVTPLWSHHWSLHKPYQSSKHESLTGFLYEYRVPKGKIPNILCICGKASVENFLLSNDWKNLQSRTHHRHDIRAEKPASLGKLVCEKQLNGYMDLNEEMQIMFCGSLPAEDFLVISRVFETKKGPSGERLVRLLLDYDLDEPKESKKPKKLPKAKTKNKKGMRGRKKE